MKSKRYKTKLVCWFLAILLVLQSCTVYKTASISIPVAAQINEKVLVKTTTINRLKLDRIEKKDTAYYGIKTIRGQKTAIPLNEKDILSIHPYDKSRSNTATWLLALVPVLVAIIVLATRDYGPDFGGSEIKN